MRKKTASASCNVWNTQCAEMRDAFMGITFIIPSLFINHSSQMIILSLWRKCRHVLFPPHTASTAVSHDTNWLTNGKQSHRYTTTWWDMINRINSLGNGCLWSHPDVWRFRQFFFLQWCHVIPSVTWSRWSRHPTRFRKYLCEFLLDGSNRSAWKGGGGGGGVWNAHRSEWFFFYGTRKYL